MEAHGSGDGYRLAELYQLAASVKLEAGDADARGFLLTQAYVFALESGHRDAAAIRNLLAADGRELNE